MTKPSAETWNAGITACERGQARGGSVDFVGTFMGHHNEIFMEYLLKRSDWNMNGLQYLMEY